MTGSTEVVCLGETMAQLVPDGGSIEQAASFNAFHAGAESNVAIGLARLGRSVAWVSRVGEDALGRRIVAAVSAEGVDTAEVVTDPIRPTGLFLKDVARTGRSVVYYRSGSAASAMNRTDVDRGLAKHPRIFHLSGITPALSASCDDATEYALAMTGAAGMVASFDVNYRASLWENGAADRLSHLANLAHIVFVGLDEAAELWDCTDVLSVREVLLAPVLVIKDGSNRAVVFREGEGEKSVPAPPVDVVEPVGAGDAFAAGYLHGHLAGWPPERSLRSGHVMAGASLRSITDHGEPLGAVELEKLTSGAGWKEHVA